MAANHILRYLKGTITYGLRYTFSGGLFLHGYADVVWAGTQWIGRVLLDIASV
jgi:hypothetical protein